MFYCLSVLFTTPCFGTVEKILDLSVQMFNACHGGKAAPLLCRLDWYSPSLSQWCFKTSTLLECAFWSKGGVCAHRAVVITAVQHHHRLCAASQTGTHYSSEDRRNDFF